MRLCGPAVETQNWTSVQRFLFDPDRADGLAVPQVATQDVLAKLGRVDPPAAGGLDAEAFPEEAFKDLLTDSSC